MATGVDQIFLEKTREALAILGVGAASKAYLLSGMDDQSSSLTNGDHIEFDEQKAVDASARIAQSSGAGQLSGLFTLAAGRVYFLAAFLSPIFSAAGSAPFQWRNNTGAVAIGNQGGSSAGAAGQGSRPLVWAIIAPAVETEVELRFNGAPSNLSTIEGSGPVQESGAIILEIG